MITSIYLYQYKYTSARYVVGNIYNRVVFGRVGALDLPSGSAKSYVLRLMLRPPDFRNNSALSTVPPRIFPVALNCSSKTKLRRAPSTPPLTHRRKHKRAGFAANGKKSRPATSCFMQIWSRPPPPGPLMVRRNRVGDVLERVGFE
jgi:hypothetical protein